MGWFKEDVKVDFFPGLKAICKSRLPKILKFELLGPPLAFTKKSGHPGLPKGVCTDIKPSAEAENAAGFSSS